MSIKIYEGFKIHAENSLQVRSHLQALSADLSRIASLHAIKTAAKEITYRCDNHIFFQKEGSPPDRISHFMELMNDSSYSEAKSKDYEFTISLAPFTDDCWLAIPFWGYSYLSQLQSCPWYEEYGYWNNTDAPNHLSPSEWEQRASDWHSVMHPSWIPSQQMLTAIIVPGSIHLDVLSAKLIDYAPSEDERALELTGTAALKEFLESQPLTVASYLEFTDEFREGGSLWYLRDKHYANAIAHVQNASLKEIL